MDPLLDIFIKWWRYGRWCLLRGSRSLGKIDLVFTSSIFFTLPKQATMRWAALTYTPVYHAVLSYRTETMVPVDLDWNLWNHEPNAIFPTLYCFSQGFACDEKPDRHTLCPRLLLTMSCWSPYHTQVHIINRTETQLRQAPCGGWGRGELTRKPCASSLRCLWDTSPGRWGCKERLKGAWE